MLVFKYEYVRNVLFNLIFMNTHKLLGVLSPTAISLRILGQFAIPFTEGDLTVNVFFVARFKVSCWRKHVYSCIIHSSDTDMFDNVTNDAVVYSHTCIHTNRYRISLCALFKYCDCCQQQAQQKIFVPMDCHSTHSRIRTVYGIFART